jgi:NodT family efflux transporter outer membrane factor (OMF) lipoprotein
MGEGSAYRKTGQELWGRVHFRQGIRMRHPAGGRFCRTLAALALLAGGCTTLSEWVHNGFKVGPNFHDPRAPVAPAWIDAADPGVVHAPADDGAWWEVFHDPVLGSLIRTAHRQNLDLKTAGTRVLQAQAERTIAAGLLFPRGPSMLGAYAHAQVSKNLDFFNIPQFNTPFFSTAGLSPPSVFNLWATGFNATWELDFWGMIRRGIESADANLTASVEAYNAALVTLLADVATNYVQVRTFQQRIAFARRNAEIQRESLRLTEVRLKEGKATLLDVRQARSSVAQTEATIPPLVVSMRQANNRLCVLLGQPPETLLPCLSEAPIPQAPPQVAVGIPADLLERRPDVRRARAQAAAQSALIGVAEAQFYPRVGVAGFIGYSADDIRRLFEQTSYTGFILPNFQWKILNFGRTLSTLRLQEARFAESVLQYQQAVLTAGREVEDALVAFLQYQLQARSLEVTVGEAAGAVDLVVAQYREGRADFNRVFTTQSQLVTQQDQLAAARGNIALSLINVYRALGGGWKVFEKDPCGACAPPTADKPEAAGGDGQPPGELLAPPSPLRPGEGGKGP